MLGKPLTLLMPERFRDQHAGGMTWFVAGQESYNVARMIDAIGKKKDGTEFPVELSLGSWTTQGAKFVTAIFRDVTERKQIAEAINQQRTFLRQVIDINPNLIFAKDREGRFILANKALADVFGTTVEDLTGRTGADFNRNAQEIEHFQTYGLGSDGYLAGTIHRRRAQLPMLKEGSAGYNQSSVPSSAQTARRHWCSGHPRILPIVSS